MKFSITTLCFVVIISTVQAGLAQKSLADNQTDTDTYLNRSPIYDYSTALTSEDSIPDFKTKTNKLKLEGTIYESDGITPAKDVIVFISHADEDGDFDLRKHNEKRYVYHRAWVKTDSDGHYTFFTFIPGNDRRYNQLQEIFPLIKAPGQKEYEVPSLLFDTDPLLSKSCRKRMAKKDDPTRILKPKMVDGLWVVQRDIVLPVSDQNVSSITNTK